MSKTHKPGSLTLLDLVLGIAWECPVAGAVVSALLLVVSCALWSADHASDTSWALMAPCVAVACATVGAVGAGVSILAFIRDEILRA